MMEVNNNQTQGFGFVPKKLEIEGKPELSEFPLNILFANFYREQGVNMSATALYEPDLDTYNGKSDEKNMVYRNIYNPENIVVITKCLDHWEGLKVVNGTFVLLKTVGKTWEEFFSRLTIVGLSDGEKCGFVRLQPSGAAN